MGLDRLLYIFLFKLCPTGDSISCSPNHGQGSLTIGLASQLRLYGAPKASLHISLQVQSYREFDRSPNHE
jgi:hypothetical protein